MPEIPTHAELSVHATFPKGSFLENLIVRSDDSLLVSSLKAREVYYVPPSGGEGEVRPRLLFSIEGQSPMSFVETQPDVFYLFTTDGYASHASSLYRFDLNDWKPGQPVEPAKVLAFPSQARALNGSCLLSPTTMLVADSFARLIWRVDLAPHGLSAAASVWLKHYSMLYHPGEMKPEQPGVNGLRYSAKFGYLYYTATVLKLFMRVLVDAETMTPAGSPEYLGGGKMMDDFCLDEDAGVAYVTTHRENTIDRMSLFPGHETATVSVAGSPFHEMLIGPSSGAWSRATAADQRIAYFTTDGGTTAPPPDGQLREAKILRVQFPRRDQSFTEDRIRKFVRWEL